MTLRLWAHDIAPQDVLGITSMTSPLSDSRYMLVIHNYNPSFAFTGSPDVQEMQETPEDPCGSDPSRAEDRHTCRAQPERPQTPRSVFLMETKSPSWRGRCGVPSGQCSRLFAEGGALSNFQVSPADLSPSLSPRTAPSLPPELLDVSMLTYRDLAANRR